MKTWFKLPLFLFVILLSAACQKEKITNDLNSLEFSTDTVIFDTVFTQIGTATRNFKIYNRGNKTLRISSIQLANPNTPFRINVDGIAAKSFTDIDILPKDSAFVFVEATINPNGGNSPLIVTDSILFTANGVQKDVDLVAWGQDAIYYTPGNEQYPGLPPLNIIRNHEVWTNIKPIVVYGYVLVDSLYSLTIEAGTKVYFHGGSGLWIYKGASIKVNGTKEQPVIFQGDRLEPAYKDLPGQWDRIVINEGDNASQKNEFNYATIKNGLIGLQVETLPFSYNIQAPTSPNKLELNNCIIQNHSALGLYARNFKIDASNVVVSNCGQYCVGITGGGEYNFTQVTIANYFNLGNRKTPAFYMANSYEAQPGVIQIRTITNTKFTNSIFYGGQETEFDFKIDQVPCLFTFENCLIRKKEQINDSRFTNITYNRDPLFKDVSNFDFHLNQNSAARNLGIPTTSSDLDGNFRDNDPDLGAYEYQP